MVTYTGKKQTTLGGGGGGDKKEKKSLVPARQDKPNEPTLGKDPFHLSSLSPHSPQFQQSAGVTPLSSLSG